MFNIEEQYTLWTEEKEGAKHYFASFTDGQGLKIETEISYEIYKTLLSLYKKERNLKRSDERHYEQSELTEETLYLRALMQPKSIEETVYSNIQKEKLRKAVSKLPQIQKHRFVLYYEYGLTLEKIAQMHGCSISAVKYSIDIAKDKIIRKIK